jgi:hypothetical protein
LQIRSVRHSLGRFTARFDLNLFPAEQEVCAHRRDDQQCAERRKHQELFLHAAPLGLFAGQGSFLCHILQAHIFFFDFIKCLVHRASSILSPS